MSIKALESHALFKITDVERISSPADLGYHPDSVLSVFDYFVIQPKQMSKSGVRGDDFVAIRAAQVDQYDLSHANVECVYLRMIGEKWELRKRGSPFSESDFEKFVQLAQGKEVLIDGKCWKRI